MTKKIIFKTKIQIISVLLIMLMSSSPNTFAQAEDIQNPNKIVMDVQYINYWDFNLDPAIAYSTGDFEFVDLSYEGLVTKDPTNNELIIGLLATNWAISTDGKTYTFNLRKDVFYHDGKPFNAYTMKYSLDRFMIINDPTGPAYLLQEYIVGAPQLIQTSDVNVTQANAYLNAKGINVINDYTLEIKLVKPFNFFLNALCVFGRAVSPYSVNSHKPANYSIDQSDNILGMVSLSTMFPSLTDWTKLGLEPNHDPKVSGIVPQSGKNSESKHIWMTKNMVGTGPYEADHFNPLQVEFVKNDKWHGSFITNSPDNIIWNYQEKIDTMDFQFRSGATDVMAGIRESSDLVPSYIDVSNGKSIVDGINAYIQPLPAVLVYGFNLNESISTKYISPVLDIVKTWNETHIINDHLVRYNNNNTYLASITNPFTALKFRQAFSMAVDYDSLIAESFYNILAIRAEGIVPFGILGHQDQLIEKGLVPVFDFNSSKQLFKEVGWKGNITLFDLGRAKAYRHVFNLLVQSAFASMDIGINIHIETMDPKDYFSEETNFPLQDWGWVDDYDDPLNSIYPYYYSKSNLFATILHYNNPDVDLLIEKLKNENSVNTEIDLIKQIEETVTSDYPYIYLDNRAELILTRSWLHNIESSGSLEPFSNELKFQYISKGDPTNTTNTNSQITNTKGSNIPGFDFFVISLVFISLVTIKIKKRKFNF